MTGPSVGSLVAFIRSIALLALDAQSQVAWLSSLGLPGLPAVADELALEFDDGCLLLPIFVEHGWLPDGCVNFLAPIDAALDAMSSRSEADVWNVEELASSPEWEEVRSMARQALFHLG